MKALGSQQALASGVTRPSSARAPAERVWVLTGSIGGPTAIRRFFRRIPSDLPTAFILSIRISADGVPVLSNLMARSTRLRVDVSTKGHCLAHREMVIAPVDRGLLIGAAGDLDLEPLGPAGAEVSPADALLSAVARRYREHAGCIVFSGIGKEGVAGCFDIVEHGGQVWVQDGATCLFGSLPGYVADACRVSFCGSPEGLADRLVETLHRTRA